MISYTAILLQTAALVAVAALAWATKTVWDWVTR